MNTMKVTIATPHGEVYNEQNIRMVTIETHNGSMGIMAKHEPTVTTLKIGTLKVVDDKNKNIYFAVSEGVAECHGKEVTIIVQTAELADIIDKDRAERAKQRAEERLTSDTNYDVKRAQIALAKALARLKVAELN
ncbi:MULTISPECIES: F0F1 ATP synthase subunit epsilon [unclassified Gemella]|uniref:F0F1 ATP synthase subunit epsilon n=1 Tax=unclassified Gemella TaxID=2624949 RepID=UPI001C059670|nr:MULTISPECIES: F0F1 ATP synthase subunit epsilon [unclassified Gemella]MBU0278418.1 F0F1 ATP synthase subunit epsilon [Gemella sp. zg-1178]QWQ38970.1 F0F1 ATP synthase subunit epsilon [Gemella sp. zg-570]